MQKNQKKKNNGFTLLEVLIASAILSVILSIVYSILVATLSSRDFIESRASVERVGARLMTFISRDLQAAYMYQLEGVYFQGKQKRIDFISNVDSLIAPKDKRSDLSEISYFLRPNREESGTFKLIRREDYFIDEKPLDGGVGITVYDRVTELRLGYYDKKGVRQKSWNSKKKNGLPIAIEIVITIRAAPREADRQQLQTDLRTFRNIVPIMVSPEPPPKEKKEEKPNNNKPNDNKKKKK